MIEESSILITGSNGQLGIAFKNHYPRAKSADINMLDITNKESVNNFDWSGIKYIFNAAAYTDVDGAETPEGRILSWKVNAVALGNLVNISLKKDITLVHISSDYVFDGTKSPHVEDEPFSPLGVYAQTKAAGDILVNLLPRYYILRTSWVIGDGKNFVKTMLGLGQKGVSPTVVSDQVGRLTTADELVRAVDHLLSSQSPFGTYNLSNGGEPASWADITRAVFEYANFDLSVTDTSTAEYYANKTGIAPRPLQSTLSLDKIESTGFKPRDWHDDLKSYIEKEINT